jgi:hypothetical protein
MQAYPFQHKDPTTGLTNISVGMTLRDYFAAKAMQGIVSILHEGIRPADIPTMCVDSYAIADAMLEARK